MNCPKCKMALTIKPELYGQTVRCPGCSHPFQVPHPQAIQPSVQSPPIPPMQQQPGQQQSMQQQPVMSTPVQQRHAQPQNAPANTTANTSSNKGGSKTLIWLSVAGGIIALILISVMGVIGYRIYSKIDGSKYNVPISKNDLGKYSGATPDSDSSDGFTSSSTSQFNSQDASSAASGGFSTQETSKTPLKSARQQKTKLREKLNMELPTTSPPSSSGLEKIKYQAKVGRMEAYVSTDPGDGKRHPAMIWIFSGMTNTIDDLAWKTLPATNDESAKSYRQNGIVTMYPSMRGGNQNPGYLEGCYGEVDDVISAAEHLAKLPYVDPARIYVGGYGSGGTLALLCGASTSRFRAVLAIGPVSNISDYGLDELPFVAGVESEIQLRSPGEWVDSMKSRTLIVDGHDGNSDAIKDFVEKASRVKNISIYKESNYSQLEMIFQANREMSQKIRLDTEKFCNIELKFKKLR